MSNTRPEKPHRTPGETVRIARRHTGRTALVVAIAAALCLAFAPFGLHEEMFSLDYAVRTLATGWAAGLAGLALILGVLALIMGLLVPPRGDVIIALCALAIGAGGLAVSNAVKAREAANPPIHDVATDWTDPLLFGAAMMAGRGEAANAVEADPHVQPQPQNPNLTGVRIADVNARTCPGAAPVVLTAPLSGAYGKARKALLDDGEVLVTENPAAGRIEASWTTKWLKLKGDVLVRIKPEGAGARVDIRSVSRAGVIDLGENCRRVTRLRSLIGR